MYYSISNIFFNPCQQAFSRAFAVPQYVLGHGQIAKRIVTESPFCGGGEHKNGAPSRSYGTDITSLIYHSRGFIFGLP
jgi:hypothetical protein